MINFFQSNNDESRWILISASLVSIIISFWAVAIGTEVWQMHRTSCTNLAAATIILVCLYFPKIRIHSKLKKVNKIQNNSSVHPSDITKDCSGNKIFNTS